MILKRITPLALVLAGAVLPAQETTSTLVGTVTDKLGGQPVAGALVTLTSPALLGVRTAISDAKGNYRIPLLPTGTYRIRFTAKDHITSAGSFPLQAGQILRKDAMIPNLSDAPKAEATVEVMGVSLQVDKTQVVTQTVFSQDELEMIQPSSLWASMDFSPGVTDKGGYSSSIRGGANAGFKVIQDGVTISDSGWGFDATIPDMIESMSVIQSPMNARYGNTDGGIVSIVTTRGSNEFSGTLRRTFGRGMWKSDGIQYGDRLHRTYSVLNAPGDGQDGEWYLTLKGPIWKDHITFAYASKLKPTLHTSEQKFKSWSVPAQNTDTQSTYFQDPASPTTILRAGDLGDMDGQLWQKRNKETWNQYTLYYQVTKEHSLQASFTDYTHVWTDPGENWNYKLMNWEAWSDSSANGDGKTPRRVYNLSYRGLVGDNNLLEVSWGKTNMKYQWPTSYGSAGAPIGFHLNQNEIQDPVTGLYRPMNNLLEGWTANTPLRVTNGIASDSGDAQTIDNLVVHYQMNIEWRGQHSIDMGVEMLDFKWDTQSLLDMSQYGFHTYGRLSTDTSQIPAQYAGKYIVYPYNATVGDLTGGSNFNWPGLNLTADQQLYTINDWGIAQYMIPRMYVQWGPSSARVTTETWSAYLNDQWTFNEHYSLMMGLRLDKFKAKHAMGTLYDYSLLSPRLEFKWDVAGDQKRVFNLSYGKFHEKLPSANFLPLGVNKWPYSAVYLWTGQANPDPYGTKPYLVDTAAMTNPANYGYLYSSQWMGGPNLKMDGSLRGPVSTQIEVGMRRAYANGGYLRLTLVHKDWAHLYDWFATDYAMQLHTPGTEGTETQTYLPKVLKEDPNAHRTYKSFEVEWSFPFTSKITLGGNYTYSRLTANDSQNMINHPDSSAKRDGVEQYRNWSDYLNTYVPLSVRNPQALRQGGSAFSGYLLFDLSRGKVKQSVSLRGSYAQAGADQDNQPFSMNNTYNIPTPTVRDYNSTANLPTTVTLPIEGAQAWTKPYDTYSTSLHYNLELPIHKKISWFVQIEVTNWMNHMSDNGYMVNVGSQDDWPAAGSYPTTMAHGPRGGWDTRAAAGKFGARTVSAESGVRF